MSLVGSLEDLGLADILQIVSLAQKSGRLVLRSGGDTGRILLRAGLVCGGAIKGENDALRDIVVSVSEDAFEEVSRLAEAEGVSLAVAIVRAGAMEAETLEALRREQAERSVMRMFGWTQGEFSFEVRDDVDVEDRELELTTGINTQYLAMEASRLQDEGVSLEPTPGAGRAEDAVPDPETDFADVLPDAAESESDADEAPGTAIAPWSPPEPDAAESGSPFDALALAVAERTDAEEPAEEETDPGPVPEPEPVPEAEPEVAPQPEPEPPVAVESPEAVTPEPVVAAAPEPPPRPVVSAGPRPPVIALDPDLGSLEWLKAILVEDGWRVHIFQQADTAVARVRQYLARGTQPCVLISPSIAGTFDDPDASAVVARIRKFAPDLPVLALRPEGRTDEPRLHGVEQSIWRPVSPGHDPEAWHTHADFAETLRRELHQANGTRPAAADASLAQLRALSQRLRDPQREDVLSLVLEFASESFARVAVFMVRDDHAVGIAQRGLPESSDLGGVRWSPEALPQLLHRALVERTGVSGRLSMPGNEALAEAIGPADAPAYAAPIESGGCVAALLYADSPHGGELPDPAALEIVLHEAGLALDRLLLERTLSAGDEAH